MPTSPEDLLAEFTSLEFNTFTLDDMAAAMSNFDIAGNPTIYILIFTCSGLNILTLLFAHFRLHRRLLQAARDGRKARREARNKAMQTMQARCEGVSSAREVSVPMRRQAVERVSQLSACVCRGEAVSQPEHTS